MRNYRGLTKDKKTWFYGDLVREISTGKTYILDIGTLSEKNCNFFDLGVEVYPNTVGQYTGLKDAYGNKIYEGDKVLDFDVTFVIDWEEKDALFTVHGDCWTLQLSDLDNKVLEIVGNIHEPLK